jgi:hypothetical protein
MGMLARRLWAGSVRVQPAAAPDDRAFVSAL